MDYDLRQFAKDDAAWVQDTHIKHYVEEDGFDASFGVFVGKILDTFVQNPDPARRHGWIAEDASARLGCIFCDQFSEETAQLRLFYVVAAARGQGVAQVLLDRCLAFARLARYRSLHLWTLESHKAAGAIYARNGLTLAQVKPVTYFGADLTEQVWQIAL
ncbi:MAG: GNAT family N-acetyltransferase [Pseudomonadota bacterium]